MIRCTFGGLLLFGLKKTEATVSLLNDSKHNPKLTIDGVDYSKQFNGPARLAVRRADGKPSTVERFNVSGWTPLGEPVEDKGRYDWRYLPNAAWLFGQTVCFDNLCYPRSFRLTGTFYAKTLTLDGKSVDFRRTEDPTFLQWSQRAAELIGADIETQPGDEVFVQVGRETIWLDPTVDHEISVTNDCVTDDCPPDINLLFGTVVCSTYRLEATPAPTDGPDPRRTGAMCIPLGCPENC